MLPDPLFSSPALNYTSVAWSNIIDFSEIPVNLRVFWDTCQSQGTQIPHRCMWGTELVTPMCWSCTLTHSVFYAKTPLCHELTDWSIVERFASRCSSQGSTLQQCTDWHRLASCRFQQVVHTWWDLTHLLLIRKSLYFSMSLKNTNTFYCIHDIKGGHNL